MPRGQPHPLVTAAERARSRRLASSGSAATDNKRVSFGKGKKLVRGPSPTYSGPRKSAGRPENTDIVNSSNDAGTVDQQIRDELASDLESIPGSSDYVYGQSRERSRPVTEAYEQQESLSSLEYTPEPLYKIVGPKLEARQDQEVCRRIHKLRAQIVDFAQEYVCVISKYKRRPSIEFLCSDAGNAKLIRYIGFLAQGGANGLDSWEELLSDDDCLTALVVGVVGMALKEHVFSALWFGGTTAQFEELQRDQEQQKDEDGYERTKCRAHRCMMFPRDPSNYVSAAVSVGLALRKLLTPLLHMSKSTGPLPEMSNEMSHELFEIVIDAGQLSREMRLCTNVIYHWPPTFKDEEFDPERMECLNITSMVRKSPYELKKQPNGQERSVLKGATENIEAIVRITAFPGLVAHRAHGGPLAKALLAEEKREEQTAKVNHHVPADVKRSRDMSRGPPLNGTEGFRTRVICKSVVHLEWGQQRLLTKEAGTSRHLDAIRDGGMAKYEDDRRGFVELFDCFLSVHSDFDRGSY